MYTIVIIGVVVMLVSSVACLAGSAYLLYLARSERRASEHARNQQLLIIRGVSRQAD